MTENLRDEETRAEKAEAQLAAVEERNRALAAIVRGTEQERDFANDQLAEARKALEAVRFHLRRQGYMPNSILIEGIDKVIQPKDPS